MTEPLPEANPADAAEQSVPVDDDSEMEDALPSDLGSTIEANPADVIEQHQEVPLLDDEEPQQ